MEREGVEAWRRLTSRLHAHNGGARHERHVQEIICFCRRQECRVDYLPGERSGQAAGDEDGAETRALPDSAALHARGGEGHPSMRLWFAIHAEAESDPGYIYNRYTAELLVALRALKVEWQWSRIQLLGMSASWVFLISPDDSQSVKADSKAQFALKFNPSQQRCNREIESVKRLAFEYASGTNADAQLHYACGVVRKDGATEFFQPSKLKNGVENSLRMMFETSKPSSASELPAVSLKVSSRGRVMKPIVVFEPTQSVNVRCSVNDHVMLFNINNHVLIL